MPSFLRSDIVLVRYPFSDLSSSKVRPAVIVNGPHASHDLMIVPLTSRTTTLLEGEFALADWRAAGLNVPSVVKRGIYTVASTLVLRQIGQLNSTDATRLNRSLKRWLALR